MEPSPRSSVDYQPPVEVLIDELLPISIPESSTPGPSNVTTQPASRKAQPAKKPKRNERLTAYTMAFVPSLFNIKNPAGDYVLRDYNVDVARQTSMAKAQLEIRTAEGREPVKENPLTTTLIIHPGSRHLRIGRASDFYPHEVPNCIARPANALFRGYDPPVPGSRVKRLAEGSPSKRLRIDHQNATSNLVETNIGYLREYLRNRLRQNKLKTDWRDGERVVAFNEKVRPEPIPEHNDPFRIDWTEANGRPFVVGTEALRLPESAGYRVRYPILNRGFNTREWQSSQLLLDDIETILQDSLKAELDICPRDYPKFSIVLIVPDHGDRKYIEEMTNLLLCTMAFKEISIQQESHCAIFSAGLSSACVVDIGATTTTVACIDDGLLNQDTRIKLCYGGDDITAALSTILHRSAFPYKELDLARAQDWEMMDHLKMRICTMEEQLVANTPWDFHVLKTEGLTQKYALRTYDENILAPLIFFDTRLVGVKSARADQGIPQIDFEEKRGKRSFKFRNTSDGITDDLSTSYDEATAAMIACTTILDPSIIVKPVEAKAEEFSKEEISDTSVIAPIDAGQNPEPVPETITESVPPETNSTPTPSTLQNQSLSTDHAQPPVIPRPKRPSKEVIEESSRSPLDAAIAASISCSVSENKIKIASSSILLIGGGSALKGLAAFLADRLPPLLRAKGFPIPEVQIVPPPRNLNPRFVPWKGASVMCNLETMSDIWIRRDEFEAIRARSLKDRCLFL